MSIEPTARNLSKYDYNHDGEIDHDDVETYIMEFGKGDSGSIKALLRFQKAGGELAVEDILTYIKEGGKVDGSDILRFVQQGGKLSKEDINTLKEAGVEFTSKEMGLIQTKLNITGASRFPDGTTPEELLKLAKNDKTITGADLASLKGPDGKPLATVDDFHKLRELGGKIKVSDLLDFQKAGGTITGPDLIKFQEKGMKLTAADLIEFAKGGTVIELKDLSTLIHVSKMTITKDDLLAINPNLTPAQVMVLTTSSGTTSVQELLAAKGPDGKPTATAEDLIALMQKGGTVTPADLAKFQEAGGILTGEDLARFATLGMKFTGAELVALVKGGVSLKEDQLKHITNNSGISLTTQEFIDINPISLSTGKPYIEKVNGPVTITPMTPETLAAMSKFGVTVTPQQLIAAYKEAGQTMTPADVKNFMASGGVVTSADLIEFQKGGVKFSGKDLAEFQNLGVKFTATDLIALSKGGADIYEDELKHIINNSGIQLTVKEYLQISPLEVGIGVRKWAFPEVYEKNGGSIPAAAYVDAMKFGAKVTMKELLALPGTGTIGNLFRDDLINFIDRGGTLTSQDLIQFQKQCNENGVPGLSGDDLVTFADKGVKLSADDLVQFAENGVGIWEDDLNYIKTKCDIRISQAQDVIINPFIDDGKRKWG